MKLNTSENAMATNLFAFVREVAARAKRVWSPTAGVHEMKRPIAAPRAMLLGESSTWIILCVIKCMILFCIVCSFYLNVLYFREPLIISF